MRAHSILVAGLLSIVTAVTPLPVAAQAYDITTLPFTATQNVVENNNGVLAGSITNPDGSMSLAEWSNGVLISLGRPSGLPSNMTTISAFGINDSGQIVGVADVPGTSTPSSSFIYSGGHFTVLPLLNSSDLGSGVSGINASGQVAGADITADGNWQAWTWSKGVISALPVPGLATTTEGINDSGTIVGNVVKTTDQQVMSAYILSGGTVQYLSTLQVGKINNAGTVAGTWCQGAAIYKDGITTPILGIPQSEAQAINDSGDVVGYYFKPGSNDSNVYLWSPSAGAVDLTPPGYHSPLLLDINDAGQIVGDGVMNGVLEDFLLTPDPNGALKPIPFGVFEPDQLALLLLGMGCLCLTRRRAATHAPMPTH